MIKLLIAATALLILGSCCSTKNSPEKSPKNAVIAGGYAQQRPLDNAEKTLFQQVTAKMDGVKYTPESVATQVVAGMNYRFICKAVTVTRKPQTYQAEVVIYQPLPGQGEARITKITKL